MQCLMARAIACARSRTLLPRVAALLLLVGLSACDDTPSAPRLGALSIAIGGVPSGAQVTVTVTGPAGTGYSHVVSASETLIDLAPGSYTLSASVVTLEGVRYSPSPSTQSITVAPGSVSNSVSVTYAVSSGALAVSIAGAPGGSIPMVIVTGPNAFSVQLSTSTTLMTLEPGLYTVTAQDVAAASGVYVAGPTSQQVQVSAFATPVVASVAYGIITGAISLNISGLPAGANAAITLIGPNAFTRQITESGVITNLVPGSYTLSTASTQTPAGHVYTATPVSQGLTVQASETPKAISVNYTLASGTLDVSVTGLPQGTSANVSVTGPNGYNRTLTGSTSLVGLYPGGYLITAANVNASGTSYSPTPAVASHDVSASLTPRQASVAYFASGGPPLPGFNLAIDGMYVTQAIQTYQGEVPLIAGRPGLLRVFVRATTANSAQPSVRVRLYQGSTLAQTLFLTPPSASVPTDVSEGTLASSWNASIPAFLIQPGLQILADVDPTNAIQEADEGDNSFPRSGSPDAPPVQATSPLNITFVPVQHGTNGATGNVTASNVEQYLVFARKVLPIRDIVPTVHAVFATSAPTVESDDATGAWFQILGEMDALRVAEGSSNYYMGIVNVPYSSGIAGYGFVTGRATVTWDRLPSGSSIAAHELSHNLGRYHSPCGGPSGVDAYYPYPFGIIGVYGYDVDLNQVKVPGTSDLMGYCGFGWISDYTYRGILNYRTSTTGSAVAPNVSSTASRLSTTVVPREASVQSREVRPALVVWGRIVNGRPVLEPAFAAVTRPVLPSRTGPHRIEARASDGRVIFSYPFEGEQPADLTVASIRQFAFAVPMDTATAQSIAVLRLTSSTGATAEFTASGALIAGQNAFEATSTRPGEVAFRVRDPAVRLAVVRDRATRQIVAFVRGGTTVVRSRVSDFDVELTDGIRSVRRAVRAVPR